MHGRSDLRNVWVLQLHHAPGCGYDERMSKIDDQHDWDAAVETVLEQVAFAPDLLAQIARIKDVFARLAHEFHETGLETPLYAALDTFARGIPAHLLGPLALRQAVLGWMRAECPDVEWTEREDPKWLVIGRFGGRETALRIKGGDGETLHSMETRIRAIAASTQETLKIEQETGA